MSKGIGLGDKALFKEFLKMKRRKMSKKMRRKKKLKIKIKWLYPHAVEVLFYKKLKSIFDQIIKFATEEIKNNLKSWINDHQDSAFKKDISQKDLNKELKKIAERIFGIDEKEIRFLFTNIGFDVSEFNQKQFQKFNKSILGIEFIVQELWEKQVLETWAETNFQLIKSLGEEYIKKVNLIVGDGVQFGKTYNFIIDQIKDLNTGLGKSRIKLIARDQVGKLNGLFTKRRQQDAGLDKYIWSTSQDERVRNKHKALEGQVRDWSESPIPGEEVQCFSGETKIFSFVPTEKLYRRFYTGKSAEFVLNNGSSFVCTLNHPIMRSDFKMISANFLNEGDDIVNLSSNGFNSFGVSNKQNRISMFENLFTSFSMIPPFKRISRTKSDFHNDGIIDQKIDIISFEWKLPKNIKSMVNKGIFNEFFSRANSRLSYIPVHSEFIQNFITLGYPSCSGISFLCKLFSIFYGHFGKSDKVRLRAISDLNIILNEPSLYNIAADFIFFRKGKNTHSVKIIFDNKVIRKILSIVRFDFMMNNRISELSEFHRKIIRLDVKNLSKISKVLPSDHKFIRIVKKSIIEFSEHVYNLQNNLGWYAINMQNNPIIVKNCRCTAIPYVDDIIGEIDDELDQES